jgi:hypothetical protein
VAVPEAIGAIREMHRTGRVTVPPGPVVDIRPDTLLVLFAVALAAAIEGSIGTRGLLAVTLAVSMAWFAGRRSGARLRYLAALILMTAAVLGRTAEPLPAFALLLIAVGAAVLLEPFIDHRIGTTDAHPI